MRHLIVCVALLVLSSVVAADPSVRIPAVVNDQAMACSNAPRWEQEQWNYAAYLSPDLIKPRPVTAAGYCKWIPRGKVVFLTGGRCNELAEIMLDGEKLCISLVMVDFAKP